MSLSIDSSRLSGARRSSTYLASRSAQGGRVVYSLRIPLTSLDQVLPVPSVEEPDPDNRKVTPKHARGFGDYVLQNQSWVAPTLLVRDNGGCVFEAVPGSETDAVGYLSVPWAIGSVSPLLIIDGQHRVLGIHLALKDIGDQLTKLDRELAKAVRAEKIPVLKAARTTLTDQLARLERESIGLDIYVEPNNIQARQMFVDVADNAKGISSALRSRFDSSKVANRILDRVVSHALLKDRVDLEQDRMTARNPNLLGAKHVADLTRGVAVGVAGRMGRKREAEIADEVLVEKIHGFLDCICSAFPELDAVAERTLPPLELRRNSLLGSVGMLRVLAGTYHQLTESGVPAEEIAVFFSRLSPHMNAPISGESFWLRHETKSDFSLGQSSPSMLTQNLQHLVGVLTKWYHSPPAYL
ncbi:DNA sulfur modification protein DndB [Actinoalloteichus hymeniacidonis]|uniref:DGQHR domain-containing protein n=1 Tax=Actinoalloteichus hymeniacidonis TaxID=340345 RepID=A0AAC9MZ17_9PSEU|nr:DNA sulfur modification protein DndB [Actinoalloteichus hymeniacidonis]AOS64963.1 DGQHR domain-containing protein [Actinoalloteichus hymeniacidonis]MBB5906962.1 DGQHR domain-containing protein [Actinoalloteichus hymeniacidonis]